MHFLQRNRWWLGRILVLPLHLLLFVIIAFLIVRLVPGDPVRTLMGQNYTPEGYEKLQAALGLGGSTGEQLWNYLTGVVRLDLGTSLISGREIVDDFTTRLPATVELAVMGLICAVIVSLLLSYVAVMWPRNPAARLIRAYSQAAGAIPEYVLAIIAIFVFYAVLHWAPAPTGRLPTSMVTPPKVTGAPWLDTILTGNFEATSAMTARLVLPIVVLVLALSPLIIRLLVSSVDEQIDAAPTLFRVACGSSRWTVLKSVYRRAAPPAVTMTGALFGYMLGGAVILESLFGFTGIGSYAVDAVNSSDFPAMQGFLLVIAALSLLVFLIVDLVNMALDPRRRPGIRAEA
ncbi:ABC transporter permease [Nakamurella leprariae]|uniref:ABC transporter permease n=1 Tax=Nakamurella leprariae TaxID=2803911 RepID=A0A939BYE2_9ACTN|nr:ABC transporter permease [Nakamurella leprariae]MBM9469463.1 ABC transporter permease [Nakamurella leprariae]